MLCSCKETYVSVLKPWNTNNTDTTQTIIVENEVPSMRLVTDKVIPLHIGKENEGNKIEPEYDVRYLQLETTEECLIGHISKIKGDGTSVFILDGKNATVFRFSQKDGSFLCKYGRRGRGPGEVIYPTDFALDSKRKEVCLYDSSGGKLLYYAYDGTLLREEPTFYFFSDIAFLGDHLVINTNDNDNEMAPGIRRSRLILADRDQTPLFTAFSNIAVNVKYRLIDPMPICGDDIYFTHILSDTIWQVKEDGTCEARYVYKFPGRDNLFDDRDFKDISTQMYEEKLKETAHKYECFITKEFVYAATSDLSSMLYCVRTGHSTHDPLPPMASWIGMSNVNFTTHTLNGTSFLKILQPQSLLASDERNVKGWGEEYRTKFLTEKERKLLSTVKKEDNPVLMIFDVKPF